MADDEHVNHSDERTPLLITNTNNGELREGNDAHIVQAKDIQWKVLVLVLGIFVTVCVSITLQEPSRTRLFESIYCRDIYQRNDPGRIGPGGFIDEQDCKIDAVQSQVALLKGWLEFFNFLPGVFLAAPFGVLADKYGRRWLLVMVMTAFWLEAVWIYIVCALPDLLPVRLVWLGAVTNISGGGIIVGLALLYTMLADTNAQAERANVFFRFGAAGMTATLIVPPLCAKLMERDPWIAITLGIGIQFFTVLLALALPETLGTELDDQPINAQNTTTEDVSGAEADMPLDDSGKGSHLTRLMAVLSTVVKESAFLIQDWRIIVLTLTFPLRMAQNTLDNFLLQYVSKRYGWTLAQATYLWSLSSGVCILCLLLILPAASSYLLEKKKYSATKKDSILACVGLTTLGIGFIIEGLAPGVPVLIIALLVQAGSIGLGGSIRALMTSFIKQNEIAKLYAVLAVVETLGLAVAGPFVAGLFDAGIKNGGGMWLGLPFDVVGVALLLVSMPLWPLLLGQREADKDDHFQDGPPRHGSGD